MLQDELTTAYQQGLIQRSYVPADFRLLLDLQALIEVYFKEERDPEFYAGRLFVTLWVLNPMCRLHFGKTVYGLIVERVVREAKGLLLVSRMSAKLIAYELGFADPACFSRFFLRETGERPGSFRRRMNLAASRDFF